MMTRASSVALPSIFYHLHLQKPPKIRSCISGDRRLYGLNPRTALQMVLISTLTAPLSDLRSGSKALWLLLGTRDGNVITVTTRKLGNAKEKQSGCLHVAHLPPESFQERTGRMGNPGIAWHEQCLMH